MNSTDPTKAITLEELIAEGLHGELTLDTTSFLNRIDDMVFPTSSVFDSYMDFIYPLTTVVTLNEKEYSLYKMRPKKLSYYLYNTVELWALLLKLNRVQSSMEFDKRSIRVIRPDQIDILTKILVYNKPRLTKSHNHVEAY